MNSNLYFILMFLHNCKTERIKNLRIVDVLLVYFSDASRLFLKINLNKH